MTACTPPGPAPDICPDLDHMRQAVFGLLPRGRAWGTHDGGPWPGSAIYRFFSSLAELRRQFNQRMCDLRRQFFCATADEMADVWLAQYGLPDDCDPFPDLCDKVGAIGGARCDYFQQRCARKGWTIECLSYLDFCGAIAGCARAGASAPAYASHVSRALALRAGQALGCAGAPGSVAQARAGARDVCALVIKVFTRSSPAYSAPTVQPARAGRVRAGQKLTCADSGISPVQCLIERIAPAHASISYVIV